MYWVIQILWIRYLMLISYGYCASCMRCVPSAFCLLIVLFPYLICNIGWSINLNKPRRFIKKVFSTILIRMVHFMFQVFLFSQLLYLQRYILCNFKVFIKTTSLCIKFVMTKGRNNFKSCCSWKLVNLYVWNDLQRSWMHISFIWYCLIYTC